MLCVTLPVNTSLDRIKKRRKREEEKRAKTRRRSLHDAGGREYRRSNAHPCPGRQVCSVSTSTAPSSAATSARISSGTRHPPERTVARGGMKSAWEEKGGREGEKGGEGGRNGGLCLGVERMHIGPGQDKRGG